MMILLSNSIRKEVSDITPKMIIINELSNRILELLRDVEELTQSDIQGIADAIIMNAIDWGQKNLADR